MKKSEMSIPILLAYGILLFGYPLGILAQSSEQNGALIHELESHFANHFNVNNDAVHLRMIHEPKQWPKQPFSILSRHGIRLGHQSLWLVEEVSGKKSPVTLEVSIDLQVLIAERKISRRSELNDLNISPGIKRIYRNANHYLTSMDELEDMMSVQIIPARAGITQSMIRLKPDIYKGDNVIVQLTNGDLLIETNGKVKKNGRIGDETQVILAMTGKRIIGEIISHTLVRIELN